MLVLKASTRPASPRAALPRRSQGPAGDPLGELGLDLLVDRLEELALAAEVVVEGAAGDARGADDLLGADAA